MVNGVITAMAIGIKDFTSNLSLLAIVGLGVFLLILIGVVVLLVRKLRKVRKDKQETIERKKNVAIAKHHQEEKEKIEGIRKQKARALNLGSGRFDVRDERLNWDEFDEGQKQLFGQAVKVVHDARKGGFSDLEIRNMFLERGWREQDILMLLKE